MEPRHLTFPYKDSVPRITGRWFYLDQRMDRLIGRASIGLYTVGELSVLVRTTSIRTTVSGPARRRDFQSLCEVTSGAGSGRIGTPHINFKRSTR